MPTLRDRLPADLRAAAGPRFDTLPFTSLYLTADEFAAESANQTMHGVLHIGRVADESGGSRAQLAVLVKPNGLLGAAYMAAIRPFRYLLVYLVSGLAGSAGALLVTPNSPTVGASGAIFGIMGAALVGHAVGDVACLVG